MSDVKHIDLIAVPCGLGAPDTGVAQGPEALRHAGLEAVLKAAGWKTAWDESIAVPAGERWQALREVCDALTRRTIASLKAGHKPLVLGGDHSIATGTWRGVARHVGSPAQPFGLIWLDAHLDAHTPEDSVSSNPHGMPIAQLLGEGNPVLAYPWLSPRHICLVGGRSWELPERVRLERFGVHVFDQKRIQEQGLRAVLETAIGIATQGTAGFGLSVDMDVFDPIEAPGVNSPANNGADSAAWLPLLAGLGRRNDCLAVELVEYDPTRDPTGITGTLACRLIESLFR